MGAILGGIGKEAGSDAAGKIVQAVDDVSNKVIPAAEEAVKGVTDHATLDLTGLIALGRNTVNGATLPIHFDLTILGVKVGEFDGQIGPLQLTMPPDEPGLASEIEVKG